MLFEPFALGRISLRNRLVMAPMTRNRATADHVPTAIMATYYGARASMGLLITEGVAPSADGAGYARIPGLYTVEQVEAWKPVTQAVHDADGRIFAQLMHTGRASHVDNMPAGARVVSSAAVALPDQIYTDSHGLQPASLPHALTTEEVAAVVQEYVSAARHAIEAGFDGVELHAANGYLIEQFLNANLNSRTDQYGGTAANRNRFALEIARAAADAIGADRVGIRVSPYGAYNAMGAFDGVDEQFVALATELGALKLAYLHLVNHESMGAPALPPALPAQLKAAFGGPFIASGGLDRERAESVLASGAADLVAFGRPALANPDLAARLQGGAPLNAPDFATFYTPGEKGYTDYPVLAA
ncbi:MAG: alkene reductase [Gemmatimonas sp.]|jgi:N-ethylmaleimide reductase|uniref:alkene reductase n=1 Tax=Gemmatimonas sp. TaxID=1962908 RepID=UPI00391EE26F|nr:alkene reductase [Gemmatimonadota bacterium]